jgi:hypothetical protein
MKEPDLNIKKMINKRFVMIRKNSALSRIEMSRKLERIGTVKFPSASGRVFAAWSRFSRTAGAPIP